MGKNKNKILLENGKSSKSAVQKYWEKQKQREAEKRKESLKRQRETLPGDEDEEGGGGGFGTQHRPGTAAFAANASAVRSGVQVQDEGAEEGAADGEDEEPFKREEINRILAEKERRRHGQFDTSIKVMVQAKREQQQQHDDSDDYKSLHSGIHVPGYGTNFINEIEAQRNRKIIERNKELHRIQELKSLQRKEMNGELDHLEKQNLERAKAAMSKTQLLQKFPQQTQWQAPEQRKPKAQNTADPFEKTLEDGDYNPVQKKVKTNAADGQSQVQRAQHPLLSHAQAVLERQGAVAMPPAPKLWQGVIAGQSTVKKSQIDLRSVAPTVFVPPQLLKKQGQSAPAAQHKPAVTDRADVSKQYENFLKDIGKPH